MFNIHGKVIEREALIVPAGGGAIDAPLGRGDIVMGVKISANETETLSTTYMRVNILSRTGSPRSIVLIRDTWLGRAVSGLSPGNVTWNGFMPTDPNFEAVVRARIFVIDDTKFDIAVMVIPHGKFKKFIT